MATTCDKIECCQTQPALGDFGGFSIVGGDFPGGEVQGNLESSFIITCPEGVICAEGQYPLIVDIPAGTIVQPYANIPNGLPIVIQVPCGTETLTTTLPATATNAEINEATNELLAQAAQCEAEIIGTSPPYSAGSSSATSFTNDAINPVTCDGLKFQTNPGGAIDWNDTTKIASLASGIFTGTTQAEADTEAQTLVSTVVSAYKAGGGLCGYWNTEQQKCPPSGPTAAVNTFFSAVSQAQADQDALDSLADCSCDPVMDALTWGLSGSATGSGTGANASVHLDVGLGFSGGISSSAFPVTGGPLLCSFRIFGNISGTGAPNPGLVEVDTSWLAPLIPDIDVAGAFDITVPVSIPNGSANTVSITVSVANPDGVVDCSINLGPP
jgi:hypothetical protein